MSIDSDARAQLGNVLNVLPQKLHKMEFDASYDWPGHHLLKEIVKGEKNIEDWEIK